MTDTHVEDATDLRFVGDATAAVLADADFGAEEVATRAVSYEALVDAGVNPGVAARIRREHSLPWAFDHTGGADLRRRSDHVRNLGSGERAWVAESTDGWAEAEVEADGGRTAEEAERAWRENR